MATIELINVEKRFGTSYAVKPINLTINTDEFVVLLGPSGCGKTTTLRMISGLEAVTDGTILFDGQDVTLKSASDRNIAFVFQFFALYSHMTARENIAFPLQAEGMAKDKIQEQVHDVAKLLRIEHLLDSRPGSLSGGDQQRIALGRALVRQPAVFLMDEPLGALDAEFRETMRAEIKQLHNRQKATTVYVTHDQVEAMAMGDRIVVMSAAEIQQVGTPTDVYHNPANLFVARFIGSPGMNLIEGQYQNGIIESEDANYTVPEEWKPALEANLNSAKSVILGFRPEAVRIIETGVFQSTVYVNSLHGSHTMLNLELTNKTIIHARAGRERDYAIGEPIRFTIDPTMVRFFDAESEKAISKEGALS